MRGERRFFVYFWCLYVVVYIAGMIYQEETNNLRIAANPYPKTDTASLYIVTSTRDFTLWPDGTWRSGKLRGWDKETELWTSGSDELYYDGNLVKIEYHRFSENYIMLDNCDARLIGEGKDAN
jgi:hypothetical protein